MTDDEQTGQELVTVPGPAKEYSTIALRAEIGSSNWDMQTENCDSVQLFGAAKLLEMLGMESFAELRAASFAQEHASGLVTPRGITPMNRQQRRSLS
jgi:hypothetical protein